MTRQTPEFVTFWDYPQDRFFVERDRDELIRGEVSGGRDKPKFRPFDLLQGITYSDAGLAPIAVYSGRDMTIFVECPAGAYPFFHREVDQDVVYFQYQGRSTIQTEFGSIELAPGELGIIPRGVSQRTIGSPDSLRWALYYTDPVKPGIEVDRPTMEYRFDVQREPQIAYEHPPLDPRRGVRADGKIREVIRVRDHPEDDTWLWRDYEALLRCGTRPGRPIVKFGYFNYMRGITGGGGPPLVPLEGVTGNTRLEAFNTVGEMEAGYHRGADAEEMWIQFAGAAQNESEFGKYVLGTSEMAYVPMGISHHVVGLDGYLRCTLYAKHYMRQLVTDADHVTESRFTITAHVRELQPAATP